MILAPWSRLDDHPHITKRCNFSNAEVRMLAESPELDAKFLWLDAGKRRYFTGSGGLLASASPQNLLSSGENADVLLTDRATS